MFSSGEKFEQPTPEILISDCALSLRAENFLQSLNITKLNELAEYDSTELKTKINDPRTFRELEELLAGHNLQFKTDENVSPAVEIGETQKRWGRSYSRKRGL
jgi:hypothetical protein